MKKGVCLRVTFCSWPASPVPHKNIYSADRCSSAAPLALAYKPRSPADGDGCPLKDVQVTHTDRRPPPRGPADPSGLVVIVGSAGSVSLYITVATEEEEEEEEARSAVRASVLAVMNN